MSGFRPFKLQKRGMQLFYAHAHVHTHARSSIFSQGGMNQPHESHSGRGGDQARLGKPVSGWLAGICLKRSERNKRYTVQNTCKRFPAIGPTGANRGPSDHIPL